MTVSTTVMKRIEMLNKQEKRSISIKMTELQDFY